ncbi:MAG: DUF6677 family protein [Acidobacteriota bacterium]
MRERQSTTTVSETAQALGACVAAWLLPGLGHFMVQRRWRGVVFLFVITTMFGAGLYMKGELFPLDRTQPLTLLAGLAEMGVGLLYFGARLLGMGAGDVEAVTYEYGYTFCVVAGLLNLLILLDAYDIAVGRKG